MNGSAHVGQILRSPLRARISQTVGCMVPPNVDCYWVGDAGPGPSYIEAGGDKHLYTNRTVRYMVHNLVWGARALTAIPIDTNLKKLDAEAKAVSA